MKILILGTSGFIGGNIFRHLKNLNHFNLFGLSRHESKNNYFIITNINFPIKNPKIFTIKDNQASLGDFFMKNKFDIVINSISYGVNFNNQDKTNARKVNDEIVNQFYLLSSRSGVTKFIHFGTSDEYGKMTGSVNEETPFNPVSTYGISKHIGINNLLKQNSKNKINDLIILRLFSIYGYHENKNKLIPYIINKIMNHTEASMTGGLQMRNYLFIDDLNNALNSIIKNINKAHELIYNLASKETMTIRLIADRICKASNKENTLSWGKINYRPGESFNFNVNTDKIKSYLGYDYEKYKFEDGIRKIINGKNE